MKTQTAPRRIRLTPEARREEIIAITQTAIARDGYRALSLREIARRCGMSAPGLMHYFPDMPTLLKAVIEHRDEADLTEALDSLGSDATLVQLMDRVWEYYHSRPDETRNFDLLEAEALDPRHPAHEYYLERNERTFQRLRVQIEREFVDAEAIARVFRLLLDGLTLRRLRTPDDPTAAAEDWAAVRDTFLARQARVASDELAHPEESHLPGRASVRAS